eukprot:COSAG01_NODE_5211_length_4407_cov_21.587279_4_plen_100_part_00
MLSTFQNFAIDKRLLLYPSHVCMHGVAAGWMCDAPRRRAHCHAINLTIPPERGALWSSDLLHKRISVVTTRDLKVGVTTENRKASRSKLAKLERAPFWD